MPNEDPTNISLEDLVDFIYGEALPQMTAQIIKAMKQETFYRDTVDSLFILKDELEDKDRVNQFLQNRDRILREKTLDWLKRESE